MILQIQEKDANRRLDKFLFAYLNNAPHSFVYKMLRKKRIKLNNARATGSELLKSHDELRFFLSEETLSSCRKEKSFSPAKPLTGIIFEDENLLVVNKPAGLPSQGGKGINDHLLARLLFYLQDSADFSTFTPAICNRLDTNTSGLVICGKSLHTLQAVNALFAQQGQVEKEYLAVVHGNAGKIGTSHTLQNFYVKDEKTNKAAILPAPSAFDDLVESCNGAKPVITRFTVLSATREFSLLSVFPVTGRSHQIRAHLASIGFPLAGDKKYGGKPLIPHYLLHCRRLKLPDLPPWEAPLPDTFTRFKLEHFGESC
jgi:23S rRNA pseudouridine955/2504/2580 synthase